MGVNSAVVDYNEGSTGIFSILKMFDISPGSCSLSEKRNSVRVKTMRRKYSEKGEKNKKKQRRKQLRKVKKDIIEREKRVLKWVVLMYLVDFDRYAFHVLFITF